ncbi:serine acetyltransferase [Paracoccus sp. IB05]|uniref:serine O-acetyltransferase n=1 Tax=Paracoccus sp. IB05 TaxID=2779367 RepID=UPI0018E72917|nr:serine acetyltransferase [Paracoccus sp. IB05]
MLALFTSLPKRATRHCYRVLTWRKRLGFLGKAVSRIYRNSLAIRYGIYLSPLAVLGRSLNLPHPTGIVIGDGVVIGDRVTIYQNVTLGRKYAGTPSYPVVGNDVVIYAGVVIIGPVSIGDGAVIAANSVVTKTVPPGAVFAGVPARRIS